jgi:hypothetical protein
MRVPWPPDFPEVVIHTDVKTRDAHPAYAAAKSGDAEAAVQLVMDLVSPDVLEALRHHLALDALLILPVVAEEAEGFNAIPDALADHLADAIARPAALGEIVQTNKVGHTRAKAFQRLVTPPTFDGHVVSGANYLLVDDHVGLGGTLANLRGYVELNGGHVIGMTALTESCEGRAFLYVQQPWICYGRSMAKHSTSSGKSSSATASTALRKSKGKSYVVNHPLTPSRISWLRQQSKHVGEVSRRRLARKTKTLESASR